jgi:hypothetical protein
VFPVETEERVSRTCDSDRSEALARAKKANKGSSCVSCMMDSMKNESKVLGWIHGEGGHALRFVVL